MPGAHLEPGGGEDGHAAGAGAVVESFAAVEVSTSGRVYRSTNTTTVIVAANTSQGTDHGTSGPVFIAGTPVKGGFYGDEPSLTDLTDGDLKTTVDFRDVYHELLSGTLGADPEPSVGRGRRDIGFLAGGR